MRFTLRSLHGGNNTSGARSVARQELVEARIASVRGRATRQTPTESQFETSGRPRAPGPRFFETPGTIGHYPLAERRRWRGLLFAWTWTRPRRSRRVQRLLRPEAGVR
jgi:hypothetical protein